MAKTQRELPRTQAYAPNLAYINATRGKSLAENFKHEFSRLSIIGNMVAKLAQDIA
jgi:hypothetical protein